MSCLDGVKKTKLILIDKCGNCGRPLKSEWDFCPFCKKRIETLKCIVCNSNIKKHWNFCPHCTSKIGTENDQRQRFDKSNEWLRYVLKQ
ncbi:MAG: zinc ribbon domain-containing protein [Clostridia bacterium]|nr:zinc ribbon domain-containing protein [Clostridia bacterium]